MGWRTGLSLAAVTALLLPAVGCETVEQVATGVDEALYEVVPPHPVTGRPMANLVTEDREVAVAQNT